MWNVTSLRSLCSDVMDLSAVVTQDTERSSKRKTTLVNFVALERSIASHVSSGSDAKIVRD